MSHITYIIFVILDLKPDDISQFLTFLEEEYDECEIQE